MAITLKLVELSNKKFAVMRKDGFGFVWLFAESCGKYKENIDYSRTWPIDYYFSSYFFLPTKEEGEAALNKIAEALIEKKEKIKIVRTIRKLKLKA